MAQQERETILVVDDDPDTREALADLLEALGFEVMTAGHGLDALRQLRTHQPPCMMLVDLMMPTMNGWVFTIELQRDPALAGIPVVLLSGIHDAQSAASYLQAEGHLEKPIDADRLFRVLRQYCTSIPYFDSPSAQQMEDEEADAESAHSVC